jgi:hypothetical protein
MADDTKTLHPVLRGPWWHIGDPAVLLDSLLDQVEGVQQTQILGLYLDTVAATLEANLKFVQGVRSVVTAAKKT